MFRNSLWSAISAFTVVWLLMAPACFADCPIEPVVHENDLGDTQSISPESSSTDGESLEFGVVPAWKAPLGMGKIVVPSEESFAGDKNAAAKKSVAGKSTSTPANSQSVNPASLNAQSASLGAPISRSVNAPGASSTPVQKLVDLPVVHCKETNLAHAPKGKPGHEFTGMADYYHHKFYGMKTASGQILHKAKMTAAHRTLPFGTKVRVTHKRTGRSCIVVINDRGPFTPGKVIDLSHAAAVELDVIRAGTAMVACTVLED